MYISVGHILRKRYHWKKKKVITSVKVFQWKHIPKDLKCASKKDELIHQNTQHELPAVPETNMDVSGPHKPGDELKNKK